MTPDEIARLAAMGNALRPAWPVASLRTFIERNLHARAYGDAAVALAWVATRTKTDTPRLLLEAGAWWKAANVENGTAPRPPKPVESCADCGRREADHDHAWAEHPFVPIERAAEGRVQRAEIARAELTQAAANLCPVHHVAPSNCRGAHDAKERK